MCERPDIARLHKAVDLACDRTKQMRVHNEAGVFEDRFLDQAG
jgi:hypothetical protein